MRRAEKYLKPAIVAIGLALLSHQAFAQGYGSPLTMQGTDHSTLSSAASRALGGTTIGVKGAAGTMFQNPASLQSIDAIQLSIGAHQQYLNLDQEQHYAVLKYYSNFSLLMEGLTGHIGKATKFMVSQTFAHLVVILFIVIGNIAYFSSRKRGSGAQGGGTR